MTSGPFASTAPLYWQRGLSVIPIEPGTKRPLSGLTGWQGYLGALPKKEAQDEWMRMYAKYGLGLLLGSKINADILVALDVDDDRLSLAVQSFLQLDREHGVGILAGKRGKKGATLFALADTSIKSTVLKGADGLGNIDFLGSGKMTVMPPSIHPETKRPYEIVETDILAVDLQALPRVTARDINILRAAVGSEHALSLINGVSTHDAGVAMTAGLVSAGASNDEIRTIFRALLPSNYTGNSLSELEGWITSARRKGFDKIRPKQESNSAALVALALEHCIDLVNDGDRTGYASVPAGEGVIVYKIGSESFKYWLRNLAFNTMGKPASTITISEAVATLEAKALFSGDVIQTYSRIAGNHEAIEIDLGRSDGAIIRIDSHGWRREPKASYKFLRGSGFTLLPDPMEGGNFAQLRDFLGLNEQNYLLFIGFLINALKPTGPYFILLVEGEQGSGKSFFCEIIKRIIDPNRALRLRLPDNEQNLMIHAKEYRLLNFDNASGMRADMSDALCSLATGGGIAVRKLYTDGELHVMSYARPFIINGISGYANRPDLLERAIPIKLLPLGEGTRKTEAEMLAEFEAILPQILGALYDSASTALRNLESTEPPRHLRMADAARWIKAATQNPGDNGSKYIDAISSAQSEMIIDRITDDALFMKLRGMARTQTFTGYIGDLFNAINDTGNRNLPQSPSRLSNQLTRLRPAMAKAGVKVEFLERDRRGQKIRISVEPDNLGPPKF